MKRSILITVISVVVIVAAIAIAGNLGGGSVITAVVIENYGNGSILLYTTQSGVDGGLFFIYADENTPVTTPAGKRTGAAGILPGQLVQITHGGTTDSTFPALYATIKKVDIIGDAERSLYDAGVAAAERWLAETA